MSNAELSTVPKSAATGDLVFYRWPATGVREPATHGLFLSFSEDETVLWGNKVALFQSLRGFDATSGDLLQQAFPLSVSTAAATINRIEPTSRWFSYVERRMKELADDEEGIDGYPARDQTVINEAWLNAAQLFGPNTPTPSVVPTVQGGIEFVWHKTGWDLELAVDPDETTVWARNRETGDTWYGALHERRGQLLGLLGYLASFS
jgi:hypothetical protein